MRLWMLLLVGCTEQRTPCAEGHVRQGDHCLLDEPADEAATLRPAAKPSWGPDEVETAIKDGLVDGFPDVWSQRDGYFDMLAHGDARCPGHEDYIDDTWLYGCTADSGYWFEGISEHFLIDPVDLPSRELRKYDSVYQGWVITGDFEFRDVQGRALRVGGDIMAAKSLQLTPGTSEWITGFRGTWIDESGDGWLTEGVSGAIQVDLSLSPEDAQIDISGAVGFSGIHLYSEQLQLLRSCDWGMSGDLSIRDPSGGWHRIDFGPSCSPCGELSFEGEPLGEVCPDLSKLVETFLPIMEEKR
jgi:hypothetical protein